MSKSFEKYRNSGDILINKQNKEKMKKAPDLNNMKNKETSKWKADI